MNPKLYALAVLAVAMAARAHVAVAPGVVLPLAVVLLVMEVALTAAGVWLAIRLIRAFRSSPSWRPVARPAPGWRWLP